MELGSLRVLEGTGLLAWGLLKLESWDPQPEAHGSRRVPEVLYSDSSVGLVGPMRLGGLHRASARGGGGRSAG